MLLDIKNIDVLYDDFQVIWDVSLNVNNSEMVALLGPNGSGKSTVLNTISNLVEHKKGGIYFRNRRYNSQRMYVAVGITGPGVHGPNFFVIYYVAILFLFLK